MIANANVTSEKIASNLSLSGNLTVQLSLNSFEANTSNIKINNVTVVNNNRQLQNINSIDANTVATFLEAGLGGGSGLFNTYISDGNGYAITTTMSTAYAAAATAGKRYVVHSIHITNIDGTDSADVSGQFSGATYSNTSFAHTIPVPAGSSVELLKKPKVLQPSDLLQLQASADSDLHATITIEEVDEDKLFGAGVDVTSSATFTDLHTATANSVLESILLANDDGVNDLKARVVWTDGADAIQGYFAYDLIIPADGTVEILEQPKYLPNGYKIRVYSNVADRLEAIVAGKVKT